VVIIITLINVIITIYNVLHSDYSHHHHSLLRGHNHSNVFYNTQRKHGFSLTEMILIIMMIMFFFQRGDSTRRPTFNNACVFLINIA